MKIHHVLFQLNQLFKNNVNTPKTKILACIFFYTGKGR